MTRANREGFDPSPGRAEATLNGVADLTFRSLELVLQDYHAAMPLEEVGTVTFVGQGFAHVEGLRHTGAQELLSFDGGLLGVAWNLDRAEAGVVLLGESSSLKAGSAVRRTRRVLDAPVGPALLGRTLDPMGRPLDSLGPLGATERRPVEREAPGIMERAPVNVPLQTGLKVIDALIPIGRGQRELVLGDRQTGKTAIAIDTILNQKDKGVFCIYCAIGKRTATVARVIAELRAHGAMDFTTVVLATEEDPAGLQFVAPYAATTIAECFVDQGRDVLVVLDDLTRHARAYRELSLLLRRPPGREAYPGDIFYIHSRLLERYTHLREDLGGGSLTALPIVETEAENISAYIPTNLISITDGQIFLSPRLFQRGVLPAVDVGKSVSRVGGRTQLPAYRSEAGNLRLSYSQFQELEAFSRFGTKLEDETRRTLEHGRRVREILKQSQGQPLSVPEQVAALVAVNSGVFDALEVDAIADVERDLFRAVVQELPGVCERIEEGTELSRFDRNVLIDLARNLVGPGRH